MKSKLTLSAETLLFFNTPWGKQIMHAISGEKHVCLLNLLSKSASETTFFS